MADEPRRSGRATKGQHKNASSSPAPQSKSAKSKSKKQAKQETAEADDDDDGEETIRCICGDTNGQDKRPFVSCDTCEVWQHNYCMGEPEDEEDLPDHYYCEQCAPENHVETLQALARGERIWETRNKIWQNERKMSKNRKGSKKGKAGWLKKDIKVEHEGEGQEETPAAEPVESQESGNKRKREHVKEETPAHEKMTQPTRQDKRRKSAAVADAETAVVDINKLPSDRQKIAAALSKIISDEVTARVKAGAHKLSEGDTIKGLCDRIASLVEYELTMNYGETHNPKYTAQFRALNANLKRNKALVERLLDRSLTASDLAKMSSQDMASEELQKQRQQMKEQLDRQAVAIEQAEGPKYRRTHKGDELIEDENRQQIGQAAAPAQPVRERTSMAEGDEVNSGSPPNPSAHSPPQQHQPSRVDNASRPSDAGLPRRQSSQNFDMNSIWAKTAQSPTSANAPPRPMQMPPRRRSSIKPSDNNNQQQDGTKDDADIDRLLQDDYDLPMDVSVPPTQIVWRGKLVQTADATEPRVNARFVAGRDLTQTIAWPELLGTQLSIDGRLSVSKAEEYLLGLSYSTTVDISVLAFAPEEGGDREAFETVFEYFRSRERYAVVNKDKPAMVRDLYIIPLLKGAELPPHVEAMDYSPMRERRLSEEKVLLATFVVNRSPEVPEVRPQSQSQSQVQEQGQGQGGGAGANGNGSLLPAHMRPGAPGPSGSPLNAGPGGFSPGGQYPPSYQQSQQQYQQQQHALPANPYTPQNPHPHYAYPPPGPPQSGQQQPPLQQHPNPLVTEILGPLQYAPSAQAILAAKPDVERRQLEHLRQIMEEAPETRTDLQALSARLYSEGAA